MEASRANPMRFFLGSSSSLLRAWRSFLLGCHDSKGVLGLLCHFERWAQAALLVSTWRFTGICRGNFCRLAAFMMRRLAKAGLCSYCLVGPEAALFAGWYHQARRQNWRGAYEKEGFGHEGPARVPLWTSGCKNIIHIDSWIDRQIDMYT